MLVVVGCSGSEQPPPLDVDSLVESTSEYQKPLLEDGVVSADEYEQSLLAYRTCVEDAGATPSEIYEAGNGEKAFDYQVFAVDDEDLERINALAEECLPEYFQDVGKVWAYQQLLSPEELQDLRPDVAECLRGVGIDVDDDFTLDDLAARVGELEDQSVIQPCVQKYPGFFAVAPDPNRTDDDSNESDDG
ncbi:hypothetical protein [Microbacterium sp. Leaf159]|uniref:hypothetical protein n=1 Tax=Microbacterium sp. Leaf159 TaxID=1736279 RepID=UPI000AC9F465|nr:hypothetical protein [Microbacterium sp. Leaf159]